jgi:FdhD protein
MRRDERATEAPPLAAVTASVLRLPSGISEPDRLAVEEPLEIRIDGRAVAVTMRTPGHDEELAVGFCLSEGIPTRGARLPDDFAANTVEVDVDGPFDREAVQRKLLYVVVMRRVRQGCARSCRGFRSSRRKRPARSARPRCIATGQASRGQAAFAATGGLHATGLFDAAGSPLCVREDVGRHNAMDKVIGWAHAAGLLPLRDHPLCVSGRLSFELVQKAAVVGCPVLVAVGAPSSLAVELAQDRGITLCGFVRDGNANVYTELWRLET